MSDKTRRILRGITAGVILVYCIELLWLVVVGLSTTTINGKPAIALVFAALGAVGALCMVGLIVYILWAFIDASLPDGEKKPEKKGVIVPVEMELEVIVYDATSRLDARAKAELRAAKWAASVESRTGGGGMESFVAGHSHDVVYDYVTKEEIAGWPE